MTPTDFIFLFMIRVDSSPILFYFYFLFDASRSDPDRRCQAKIFVCPVPKISHVMMKWCRRASHLGKFTLWLHSSVDLLCGTTDAELHNSPVNLLCDTTDAELNNPV